MRWTRPIPFRSLIAIMVLLPSWSGEVRLALLGDRPVITATPVALYPKAPDRRRLGGLVFERGYRLTSPDRAFGGFSSLLVNGDRFTLLSDGGNIVRFRLDAAGRLGEARFAELSAGPGSGWTKRDRDSEAMALDPATGQIWVGFERANQIWRFGPALSKAEISVSPPAMAHWPANGGVEAMARLRDGRFIVLSEEQQVRVRRKGHPDGVRMGRAALLFTGDPVTGPNRGFRFGYLPPSGFSPSDIAELPDGQLLILNRDFDLRRGFTVVLTLLDPRLIRPDRLVSGRPIASFEAPALHDNFEGIAVVRDSGGLAVWLISDDNQSRFQQTLLLKFRLERPATVRQKN